MAVAPAASGVSNATRFTQRGRLGRNTNGDAVIRFFIGIPTQEMYRDLLLSVHDPINAEFPNRYKRFIRSGDDSHTSLRGDLFYTGEANGVPLYEWTDDFVNGGPGWVDIVEDFVPLP